MALYCGWDGGGTRTTVLITDEQGQQVAMREFGPLNPNGNPRPVVARTIRDSVAFMLEQGPCQALVIGMAGASNQDAVAFLTENIRAAGYQGEMKIAGDQEIALEGALEGPGAVLISGTGSVCCGRDKNGKLFRSGGYGWIIDDLGSGYAIGHDILMAAVRDEDTRGPATVLKRLVLDAVGAESIPGLITWLYSPGVGKKEIADLARLLRPGLEAQDPTAIAIAEKAAKDLADMVIALWHHAGLRKGELVFSGSILSHYPEIAERLTGILGKKLPGLRITEPHGTAAQGAAAMARKLSPAAKPAAKPVAIPRSDMNIRPMKPSDIPELLAMLKRSSMMSDVLWLPMTEEAFLSAFTGPDRYVLVAADQSGAAGFSAFSFVPGERPTVFLTMLLVNIRQRRKGAGSDLLTQTIAKARELGAAQVRISPADPVPLSWHMPKSGTIQHNCIPGVYGVGDGLPWLKHHGFRDEGTSVCLARTLRKAPDAGKIAEAQSRLLAQGIRVGQWAPGDPTAFDTLCDHVGSEYWRRVLKTELAAWETNSPNADPAFWPDGRKPEGPRPLLAAMADDRIVGFTGPVDRQSNGRGWFTGICVDPDFGGRGIATLLFDLLLTAFCENGSDYISLYTGETNHARRIYERAGLKPQALFHIMSLGLTDEEQA